MDSAMTVSLIGAVTAGHLRQPGRPSLAFRSSPPRGAAPTIVFLPGYASDMAGSKATALFDYAAARDIGCFLFDYAGCGASEGAFADQTLDSWLADALSVIDATGDAPLLVIGSSMGGWLMLRAALARPARVHGLIGIAAAPDFTDWDFDADKRAILACDGRLLEPNPYGPEPTLMTKALWDSGQASLLLHAPIAIDCPVALLHGQADADVPWAISMRIAEQLRSAEVEVTLVKDGDHRLSRAQDIALLLATTDRMIERMSAR
jgi:pimeloyl-ACP methyl ester carboxylesterase